MFAPVPGIEDVEFLYKQDLDFSNSCVLTDKNARQNYLNLLFQESLLILQIYTLEIDPQ